MITNQTQGKDLERLTEQDENLLTTSNITVLNFKHLLSTQLFVIVLWIVQCRASIVPLVRWITPSIC